MRPAWRAEAQDEAQTEIHSGRSLDRPEFNKRTYRKRVGALGFTNDDAFFDMMRSRMPERDQRIVQRLEAVKSVYVECGRDKALREAFDAFLRNFVARRGAGRDEAEIFFLTGESGAGKSAAVERLLADHPTLQPFTGSFGTITPFVSVKLKGFTLPRIAGRNIIAAAGYPIRQDSQRGEIWDVMAARLKSRRVFSLRRRSSARRLAAS